MPFKSLETYLLEKKTYQQQVKRALRYPFILLAGLLLLLGLMSSLFLPQFQSQLEHMETQSSSLASKSLIYSISLLNDYGIYLLSGLISSFFLGFLLSRFLEKFQEFVDQIFFKIPLVGVFKKSLV